MMAREGKFDVVALLLPCGRVREPRVRALKVVLLSSATYDVAMAEAHAAVTGVKLDMVTLLLCGRVREPPVRATKVLPSAVHVRAVFVVFVVVHLRCCSLALGAHKRVVGTAVSNGGKTAEGGSGRGTVASTLTPCSSFAVVFVL